MLFRTSLYDLRLTLRHAGRAKAFYASAVLTLALGMAGATVMFTLVRGIVLRPLPVPDEDRLVVSWRVPRTGLATHVPYRSADVEEIGRASRSFEKVTGVGYNGAFEQDWRLGDVWITAKTVAVMGGFFDVAGVRPEIGRVPTVEDDRRGAERLVVLSHAAWVRLFAAAPEALGQTLFLQNKAFTVAGVMPADFAYPGGSEIWTTLNALADIESNEAFRTDVLQNVELLVRLRHGVTVAHATDELATMMVDLDARIPGAGFTNFRPMVRPFKDMVVGDIDTALGVLFVAVGLILAIASANVANLLLMRGEGRRAELAVRAALGASRNKLVAQLLAESLVVALAAAVVGLGLARWSLQTVVTLVPDGLPRPESIRIDVAVVAFSTGVALLSAALAGVVPALTASRLDLVGCLRAGGRGTTGCGERPRPTAAGGRAGGAGRDRCRGRGSSRTQRAEATERRHGCCRRSSRSRRVRPAARALRGYSAPTNVPRRSGCARRGSAWHRVGHTTECPAFRRRDRVGCAAVYCRGTDGRPGRPQSLAQLRGRLSAVLLNSWRDDRAWTRVHGRRPGRCATCGDRQRCVGGGHVAGPGSHRQATQVRWA